MRATARQKHSDRRWGSILQARSRDRRCDPIHQNRLERLFRSEVRASLRALAAPIVTISCGPWGVGAGCAVLEPILRRIEAHVFAAERLHGDDTTVPVLAKGKTDTGRCWVYVRDDRSFGGTAPPAAMFYYSRDRAGEHPQAHLANYAGIFQADAYG